MLGEDSPHGLVATVGSIISGLVMLLVDWIRRGIRDNTATHEKLKEDLAKVAKDVSFLRGLHKKDQDEEEK